MPDVINSTAFGTGTLNVRHNALILRVRHISAFVENNSDIFLYVNKVQSLKLFNDIYIHFALEKEIGKIIILKKHPETLHSILNFTSSY